MHGPEELSAGLAYFLPLPGYSPEGVRLAGWHALHTGGSIARMTLAYWACVAATGGQ
jgi:hypothetical protein